MDNIIIFGAGRLGDLAYHYYKNKCKILAYIDNNERLWYSEKNGIKIYPPSILKDMKGLVVVANVRCEKAIKEQLRNEYGVVYTLIFRVLEEMEELNDVPDDNEREIIVSFMGGLGNQMFQYAFYKMLEQNGKKVSGDLFFYVMSEKRSFDLMQVFPYTRVQRASGQKIRRYKAMEPYMDGRLGQIYLEPNAMDGIKTFANKKLFNFNIQYGYFRGYFQTRVFPQIVEKELRREYVFLNRSDKKLDELIQIFCDKNIVGVHVRRGDYLQFSEIYGNICTDAYYQKAIAMIQERLEDPVFCFFSNDIEWVKENYLEKNSIYIEESMFSEYHDWYDMYLMSMCKHNIIANSSFSWWGAWLNSNPEKIVIAPQKWINADSMEDICPKEWIRI